MADGRRADPPSTSTAAGGLPPARGDLLLIAVDESLEVSPRAELGHRRLGHLDGRAGRRIPCRAGRTVGLLENTESGNRYLVALGDRALDGVENCVQRFGGGFLVPHPP